MLWPVTPAGVNILQFLLWQQWRHCDFPVTIGENRHGLPAAVT